VPALQLHLLPGSGAHPAPAGQAERRVRNK
jgi:hypothetical protein